MTINFDQKFIKTLRQKLTVGNARSVHLNSLPGRYATRLDLSNLSSVKENLPDDFIKTLLSKPNFNFEISLSHLDTSKLNEDDRIKVNLLAKRLNSLYYENNDNFLEFGIQTFGFGFPLLIRRDKQTNASIIAAPLLIWNLDIQKSSTTANKWNIKRGDDYPISINEVLISHIQKDENISINGLDAGYLEDALIDYDELNTITNEIFSQLGIKTDHLFSKVEKCVKDKSELKNLTQEKPWVLWAGIFGLYRSQKESLIKEYDKLIENPEIISPEQLKPEHYTTSSVSAVETDPSQIGILNALKTENQIIIQGPPGCGKSQSLTALISNALVEQKKCLIVCEKKTALDVIYNNLEKVGLEELCVIVDDVYKDRQSVVKNVRQRSDVIGRNKFTISKEFEYFIGQVNKYREQINKNHISLSHRIFGDSSWTEVVALFLRSNKKNDKKELDQILNRRSFKFNYEEYSRFDLVLSEAIRDIKPFGSLGHSLFNLSPSLFNEAKSYLLVKEDIVQKIANTKSKLDEINSLRIKYFNEYNSELDRTYSNLNSKLNQSLSDLYDQINRDLELSPLFNDYTTFSEIKLSVYSLFCKKYKNLKIAKNSLAASYDDLIAGFNKYALFEFRNDRNPDKTDYNKILENIARLKGELKNWWIRLPEIKKVLLNDLKSMKIARGISFEAQTKDITSRLLNLYNEINEIKLCTKVYGFNDLSSFNEIEVINNDIKIALKDVENNLGLIRDLYVYYEFTKKLNQIEDEFVISILNNKIEGVKDKFRSWYLFWLLANFENDKPRNESDITELISNESELKRAQLTKILNAWRNNQSEAIERFKNKSIPIQTLYNLKGSATNKRNPLRKIISSDFDFFTDFFPVILTNPVACSSIIPLKQNLFDFVIFDEASQLRLEDTFTSVIRGKYKIISGDKHQMPPSNYFGAKISVEDGDDVDKDVDEIVFSASDSLIALAESESLLSFAETSGFRYSPLDIHYRSRHPHLINFSNVAFYGSRLIPMPPKDNQKAIRFFEVNGIYENHKSVNPSEAVKAIELLKSHIPDFLSGKYESIGIATLNMFQRNLILEMIRDEAQSDSVFASVIDSLSSSKNFFVKNLENIQGDEKDIIIFSTTFGLTADGSFIQNFGPLNQEKGYKLLNVIVTRAKYKLYVCTSIPQNYYMRYADEVKAKGNVGKGIFYAYLAYTKSLEDENIEQTESILNLLSSQCSEKVQTMTMITESVFEQEVVDYLSEYIDPKRIITQYKVGGFRIDIVIIPQNGKGRPIAIECDGADFHSSPEAYAWDMFRQKRLEENGFIFYRIWSAKWWDNTEKEVKELVEFISKV
jgi:superfamily I DNA and/or RNA helicase/very-short-patch-repair endonuclease